MRIITDWHLHSRYSRACSKELSLENNALWCAKKGVNVLGTADFTHPAWFTEIKNKLIEAEQGMFKLKSGEFDAMRYMLTTEVSQIYTKGGKTRRVHNIILAPSIIAVQKFNTWLTDNGFNIKADGRPILGLDSEELYKRLKDIDEKFIVIPAHAWTPWYAIFGSKSGFDSIEECFGEMTPYVYAIETGLSSDPLMNRSLSALDDVMLISNSDAHSPRNFGREANVFELKESDINFDEFVRILKDKDRSKFKYTIEFHPEEGKYHADGHEACEFWCEPAETKRLQGICPKCNRPLTVGVLSRVSELADRKITKMPKNHVPYRSIVPLQEVIAESFGLKLTNGKKVQAMYELMIASIGNEFEILLDAEISDITKGSTIMISEAIRRMRANEMNIRPGYDGVFGEVKIF
ncbi:DNA helicase UvrD [Candidatus Uhrbacteria bacterium CG_4_10_14_0_2_um_filter_41_7]|uniref:DNA helicase UvrD n=1 Tax=Candidatus Uhrbacteria bacterium CG_4_9_14_3_um_filter_41_35 TaxID=1975034 RepID=A0A2M7XGY4_9BACT|nr:MAG: DNA helicase UvrD [Candidatus Uhrbacteria bacterium CG_4_10_14_0_2_um_filter_41_7]PJA47138.1 MAG: DNA helicase UvrD [Candidatus Uhrbacteria bacterium CG_4_9_14_3_um_filter_41_35]